MDRSYKQQISCYQPNAKAIATFNICNCDGQVACLLGNDGNYSGGCYQESQTQTSVNYVSASKKVLLGFLGGYAVFYFTVKLFKKFIFPRRNLVIYS